MIKKETKTQIKKTLIQFFTVIALMMTVLTINASLVLAQTQGGTTQKGSGYFELPSVDKYGNVPEPPQADAQTQFASLTWTVVQNVRFIIGAVAILMIVIAGVRMVIGWGNEETYSTQRKNIFYGVVGLAVVGLSGELANTFQVACPPPVAGQPTQACVVGGFLKNPNAIIRTSYLFDQTTQIIIIFIKYFVGGATLLMIGRNILRFVAMGDSEEKMELDKKNLAYDILGLIFIIFADTLINKVVYVIDKTKYPGTGGANPAINVSNGVQEIVGFTNFIITLVGPLTVTVLFIGGIMYLTAGSDGDKQTKAKRIITVAIVGLIIIYGAFAIVNTIIAGNFPNPKADTETTQSSLMHLLA